jgi:hypothetical protein
MRREIDGLRHLLDERLPKLVQDVQPPGHTPQSPLEAPGAAQPVHPTVESRYGRLRVLAPWVLAILAVAALAVLGAWPR